MCFLKQPKSEFVMKNKDGFAERVARIVYTEFNSKVAC